MRRWYQMPEELKTGRPLSTSAVRRRQDAALRLLTADFLPNLPEKSPPPRAVASALGIWFKACRRQFAWRSTRDPYRILISEILLRKTGAAVVDDFLPKLFAAYPSPRELAAAPVSDLAALLGPVGLARQRGRQLHELGQRLVGDFHGEVPSDLEDLLSLPGVGPYTAAMVAATSFDEPVAAVDTNVARVLCRVFELTPTHSEARKSSNVWQAARALLSAWQGPAVTLNWALLDLGGLICTVRQPRCQSCPLQNYCTFARRSRLARIEGRLGELE